MAAGEPLLLGSAHQRVVLALLLIRTPEPLSRDVLIDALWGERPPATAAHAVHVYISGIRKLLDAGGGDAAVRSTPSGYVLDVELERIDARRFERSAAEAQHLLATDPAQAAAVFEQALGLWRGAALDAFERFEPARREAERLGEQRTIATEGWAEARLACGEHAEVIGVIEELAAANPLRERPRRLLMLALYRSGRQAEALAVYRDAHVALDAIGLQPGPELRRLEAAILHHDASLLAGGAEPQREAHVDMPTSPRLPTLPTVTIGRQREVEELARLLTRNRVRLLTLTGAGGVGKTRLALVAAQAIVSHFPDGVRWVELAAVGGSEHAVSTIARAVKLAPAGPDQPIVALKRFFADRTALLVLDNLEHLLEGIGFVGDLLAASPGLQVIATSREPLRLGAEHCVPVQPLDRDSAVRLFSERARSAGAQHPLDDARVRAICARLDDLPLAIELAAARLPLLSIDELLARLGDIHGALAVGPRDAPARQRTLRATIDWSFDRLTTAERQAFLGLAVFAGGGTVDAAEQVTGASLDILGSLVAKNLLVRRRRRLDMLETVRQYAAARLNGRHDAETLHHHHAVYFCDFAERAERGLAGPERGEAMVGLDEEANNLRAALRWTLDRDEFSLALRIAAALADYWLARGIPQEGLAWVERASAAAGPHPPAALRAKALLAQARLYGPAKDVEGAEMADRRDPARRLARTAADLYQSIDAPAGVAACLIALATIEFRYGEFSDCAVHSRHALEVARTTGDDLLIGQALGRLAATMPLDDARPLIDEAITRFRGAGNAPGLIDTLVRVAYAAIASGAYDAAGKMLDEALAVARPLDEPVAIALVRGNQGLIALFEGDDRGALAAFREELVSARDCLAPSLAAEAIAGFGAVAARNGDFERAARLYGAFIAQMHGSLEAVDHRLIEEIFGPARERYGLERWDHARDQGARMPLDTAIGYALDSSFDPWSHKLRSS